jgi:UDP-N-acetylmuramoyl-tripeptide--D-alanyl-D-alanine ligase
MTGHLIDALFLLALAGFVAVRTRTLLAYFQQEEYDSSRFPSAIWRMRLVDIFGSLAVIVFVGGGLLLGNEDLGQVLAAITLVCIALRERRYKFKKPLVLTPRLRRLAALSLVLLAVLAPIVFITPLFAVLVVQAVPLAIMAANMFLASYEKDIGERYVAEASRKLAGFHGVRIGITGSFGKTTVKHTLGQMLAIDGTPFFSRGSINTVLGLTRHIRQRLQPAHTHFIAEMGAYQIGSIAKLCAFVQPEYGIVTAVGDAHRERFGGIAQVAEAKSELAKWACEHGKLLVTTEAVLQHKPFRDLYDRHREKFMIIGPSADADVQIVESHLGDGLRSLTLRLADGQMLKVSSPLLAKHSDDNLALAIALVSRISPETLRQLATFLPHLEQTPHRLERKERVRQPMVLDDAYNSNELGFREAVEVLKTLADERQGKAILITPGIVELGDAHDAVHRTLGTLSGALCDQVYVVNPDRIPSFVEGLRANGNKAEVTLMPRFMDALRDANSRYGDSRNVILYENDLPDLLEEKRLL